MTGEVCNKKKLICIFNIYMESGAYGKYIDGNISSVR